jgi:hypothetical protein
MPDQSNPINSVNAFNKGMVKDLNDTYIGEGLWTHARNAVNNSHLGESGVLGNEQSNVLCASAPYDIIGVLDIKPGEWLIYSTNDTDNEIGILTEHDCKYTKLVNDRCLGFKKTNLITGAVKMNYDCTYSAYWADDLNADRWMNLTNIPYKYTLVPEPGNPTCIVKKYTTFLDCNRLLLHPYLIAPCMSLRKARGAGQLPNGAYQVAIAYSVNGVRVTDYFTPSNVQTLFSHENVSGSLELNISELDEQFDEFELVMVANIANNTTARKIGLYSTSQRTIMLDNYSASLEVVPVQLLPLLNPVYEKSHKMFTLNGYLLRSGVTTKPDFNYQPLANKIHTKWVSVEYPSDYYVNGGHLTSYLRDEQYSFFIRWIYNTGHKSASYHIPGRLAEPSDRVLLSSADADVVDNATEQQYWQAHNTARITRLLSGIGIDDGGIPIAEGDMGYWESTEKYPADKPQIWGDLCGRPIRHHKFPDTYTDGSDTTNLYNQGGDKIRILGVRFENIEHPLDINGNPITEIVGYEILRGTREGNRTIVAKGLINNMRQYNIPGQARKGLYQNYPFNDLGPDKYHEYFSNHDNFIKSGRGFDDPNSDALVEYRKDMFSFHSPETNFRNPYLSTYELKMHHVAHGTMEGRFKYVYKHPEIKLLSDSAMVIASLIAGLVMANAVTSSTPITIGGSENVPMSTPLTAGTDSVTLGTTTNAVSVAAQAVVAFLFVGIAFNMINETVLQTFIAMVKERQYALQMDAVGDYNRSAENVKGNVRRRVKRSNYVDPTLMQFGENHRVNNLFRNRFVGVEVDREIANPSVNDESRKLITEVGVKVGESYYKNVSSYYASLKVDFQNQYGQLANISQVPVTSCVYKTTAQKKVKHASPVLFGGDVYINRFTEKNTMPFFNTNACGLPDNSSFDYRLGVNIPYPRYWVDSNKLEGLLSGESGSIFNLPSDYRRLNGNSTGLFSVQGAYFYLYNSGIREFFCESEINLAQRDWGERTSERHYDRYTFTSTDELLRSDIIQTGNYFKYDYSLSLTKFIHQYGSWGFILPNSYDPYVSSTCFANREKRVLYSLQQQSEGKRDNWRAYLVNNYKDFNSRVTAIKGINKTGAIILYENAEPTQFVGVDQLQTDAGTKITIGDGGLFNQALQSLVNADDTIQYGSCLSGRSVVNTPHGMFYVSQQNGKIMLYSGGGIDEISRNGLNFWFQQHLPSRLLQRFPNYQWIDNPVAGIGTQTVYDSQYELVYFSKRDYIPLDTEVKYDPDYGFYKEYATTVKVKLPSTYECPAGYTYDAVKQLCVKYEYTNVNSSSQTVDAIAGPTAAYHGIWQPKLYEPGYSKHGEVAPVISSPTLTLLSNPTWGPNSDSSISAASYVKLISVRASGAVVGTSYSFQETVCINETKLYYIAVSGDDSLKVSIDGELVLDMTGITTVDNPLTPTIDEGAPPWTKGSDLYNSLHIYPITITKGNHLFNFEYSNIGGPDMFAYSLFDMTKSELIAVNNAATPIYTPPNTTTGTPGFWSNPVSTSTVFSLKYAFSAGVPITSFTKRGGKFTKTDVACPDEYILGIDENCQCKCTKTLTSPKVEIPGNEVDKLVYKRTRISLQDTTYFKECAWTVSYDPKQKMWLSFHDWHPGLVIQPNMHFMTVKGPSVYKHNQTSQSYCNFYGVNYPWEVELPTSTGPTVTTIRSGEYILENYIFSPDGLNAHEVLDHNFDQAIVYNNEQISGVLNLFIKPKNDPLSLLLFPRVNIGSIDTHFSKEENKYRINQFFDITNDRGEFTTNRFPMWITDCNGYTRKINADYVNYNKPPIERKKFRHYSDRFLLIRTISGNVKMLMKLFTTRKLYSPR